MTASPLSVSELTGRIKRIVDSDPLLSSALVRGEISNYKIYPSGHHYFSLKDKDAALRCVMFRSDADKLRFRAENGMSVICAGRVSVYPRDGAYQLYVSSMQPDGVGDLYAAYEQLKARLGEEGLFDPAHKKPLPYMPQRIAVITSGAGAAVRDIIRILGRRWPLSKVIVLPVRVQGTEAPAEIVGAIRYANRHRLAELIITGRGGGSMEDLWAFNDERVVRAIYDSEIPVISAVGHEPDVTLSDFSADRRASTPSNAAELAVPEQEEIRENLRGMESRIERSFRKKLELSSARLTELSSRPVMQSPVAAIHQRRQELDHLQERLSASENALLADRKGDLTALTAALEAMSPLKVLARGFSVVTDSAGHILSDARDTAVGDSIHVTMAHGGIECRVERREE